MAVSSFTRRVIVATAVAGTLDIAAAIALGSVAGRSAERVLQSVASGPFGPEAASWGLAGAAVGLIVHFAIMTVMAAAFAVASDRMPALGRRPVLSGLAYGLFLWAVMYWVVLPLRWPALFPTLEPVDVAGQIAIHLLLVGLPIAFLARR